MRKCIKVWISQVIARSAQQGNTGACLHLVLERAAPPALTL